MRTALLLLCVATVIGCTTRSHVDNEISTPATMTEGTFTFNLPCQVMHLNSEQPGKALMVVWLHGGVHDRKIHSFFTHPNHYDNCAADDSIVNYLMIHGIKSVVLFPMCHRADKQECVAWRDVYDDVNVMIEDYVSKGLIDEKRIYLAGSSDGGRGTWDFVAEHPERFAAAIAMSCSEARMSHIPVYFYNTRDEEDCSALVGQLREQGGNIPEYEYHAEYKHGGDAACCTTSMLDRFFSVTK